MGDIDSDFIGSIPEIYDSHLVPILFESYAKDLAQRVARSKPAAVLEIAAGSGAVTRALAPLLGPQSRYVATDLNGAMLERAKRRHPGDGLEWREANATALPFDDDSFDVVLCQFGAMFFPDRIKGFSEARRVLRSGGRFVFSTWGPLERNDFSRIAVETLIRLYPENPPLFLARTPFGYSESHQIEADLTAAGFDDYRIEEVSIHSVAETADHFAYGQTHGSPLGLEIEALGKPTLQQVRKAIANALIDRFGQGRITGETLALVTEAVAP
ncbi:class I SAM-dependent methyltransferase [Flavimaricola marinus]|uniref:Ubiquinone/menaquinone biosynthesis C-methyltransferase UbiE n=1 Tax=Flavimaricola marinus TaxID=1819565 RepID=A0A238LB07_9RHOB|nr:class I SAM-dependent methyltransferase [Flavimaricola marinus]SMY06752.1 Ubiquinone/menaquinone biosynthesis C-methyltransferase UbiE [Flavimaricola marinus]